MDLINEQSTVLVIYEEDINLEKYLAKLKNNPRDIVTKRPVEVLNLQTHSAFSIILSGVVPPHSVPHDAALLSAILKLAKPDATIVINQVVKHSGISHDHLLTQLRLAGFTKISEPQTIELSDQLQKEIQQKLNINVCSGSSWKSETVINMRLAFLENVEMIEVKCQKPNFEVGSSAKLSLKSRGESNNVSAVWKLDDDDDETINPDELLDEDDLARPDATGLRVCSTSGKRKACKDCSCGLAEELLSEKQGPKTADSAPKSSCGSCYLGDAFRCATCPYLGMPAFKPGEKIILTDNQLKPDS